MNIVGIHPGHDASLALIKDGKLVHSVAMERFSGRKKSEIISFEFFERFLWDCNLLIDDIDFFTMAYWNSPNIPWMEIYSPPEEHYPLSIFGRDNLDVAILNHLDRYHSGAENWKPQFVDGL